MLTPPQDRTGLLPVAEPAAMGRWRSGTPVAASYASRKPFRSTVYAIPFATETGSPQCAPSTTGDAHRRPPPADLIDQTYPPRVIGPYTELPSNAVDPTMPPTEEGGPTIVLHACFMLSARNAK